EVRQAACSLPAAPRVVNLEPTTLGEVLASLRTVAEAAECPERGEEVVGRLSARIAALAERSQGLGSRPRVALLEWIDPPFSCGHWSPELVELAGGLEVLGQAGQRSRMLRWEEVLEGRPEVLVLACCGFGVERTLQDVPILTGRPGWADLPCV